MRTKSNVIVTSLDLYLFLDGWFVFYNLRPHQRLDGSTPAKIPGVNIEFENWKFMIQKATKFQAVNSA